jgi:hypothetical protein
MTAPTPEHAAPAVPGLYARWWRDVAGASDEAIGSAWRMTFPADRKFWTELDAKLAALAPQPAPEPHGLRAALVDAMLRWSGRDRADVDRCASELAAILDQHPQPQPAPELAQVLSSPAELARWVEASHGDHPEWVDELRALLPATERPAAELAAAMAETARFRNWLDDFTHVVIDLGEARVVRAAERVRAKAGLPPVKS